MFEPTAIHVQPDGTELKQFSVRGDIPGFFEDCGKIMAQERVRGQGPLGPFEGDVRGVDEFLAEERT